MSPGRLAIDLAHPYAAVVSGGDVDWGEEAEQLVRSSSLTVAADRGAEVLYRHGLVPSILVGDFDSCDRAVVEALRARGAGVIALERDKDKTDTEEALDLVSSAGFQQAVVLGAVGGERLEHSVANLSLIEAFAARGLDVVVAHGRGVIFGLAGSRQGRMAGPASSRTIRGGKGDFVSLFPVTREARGVTTGGLRFPLSGATLRRGSTLGTSNEMTGEEASLSLEEGFLLVVVTRLSGRR